MYAESTFADEEDVEIEGFRNELADIPLGELQKLKETVGLKKYNEALFGTFRSQSCELESSDSSLPKKKLIYGTNSSLEKGKKKKTSSAPEEKSSKIFVRNGPRKVVNKVGRTKRDPRFDDLSGNYNEDLFKKSYTFVEDMRKSELKTVKKQLIRTKSKEKRESLNNLLKKLEQKDVAIKAKNKQKEGPRDLNQLGHSECRQRRLVCLSKKVDENKL